MTEKSFMTVEEVAAELRVSKSKAYQIVRELNAEMQSIVERSKALEQAERSKKRPKRAFEMSR